MPLIPLMLCFAEKHKQAVYREDCLWLMAAANMPEKHRSSLVQPYLRRTGRPKAGKAPRRTREETVEFIFEGIKRGG